MFKPLLNRPEEITHLQLARACEQHGAMVFSKVRMADVLRIEASGLDDVLFRFALQAHFDFVVAGSDHMPLFAVEFDGPGHAHRAQQERDAKKDGLADRFGLALLRINGRYLDREYRGLTLLCWFVQAWFAKRWFDEAQASGEIPYDDLFGPTSVLSMPGSSRQFPLYVSAGARNQIQELYLADKVKDMVPSYVIGRDASGTYRALSYLRLTESTVILCEAAMKAKRFPVSEVYALEELAVCLLYDELLAVLAGKESAMALDEAKAQLKDFADRHRPLRVATFGGSI